MAFNILNIGYDGTVSSTFADRTGYVSNGDNNDIFYFLGTNYGTTAWSNPAAGLNLTVSGGNSGDDTTWVDNTTTSNSIGNGTSHNHQFEFDTCIVNLTRVDYYVYAPSGVSSDVLQQVRLEVSPDGVAWTQIAVNNDDVFGDNGGQWITFDNLNYTSYNPYFRIGFTKQIAFNNANSFRLGEVKAYGTLKRTDGGEASRTSLPQTIDQLPDIEINSPQDGDYLTWAGGVVQHTREKLYETVRTTNNVVLADNQFLPNFYIITPSTTRTVDLPPNPVAGQFFRIRNLNTTFEIQIREPGPTLVATIGGAGGPGLTQADCYYDGTEWTVIQY